MVTRPKIFTRIVRIPGVVGGEPVVAGTRISVRVIVQYDRIYHHDFEKIVGAFPHITYADIEEALAFYEANRGEIDRYIAENEDDEVLIYRGGR